ncbi:hypothetical protein [Rhizobium laguerreae]|uniref:hypothetical protein n=1 Tax=Rhizobium laguerreae TaxID=1076926 RepID=UPI001C923EDF|nr:hypothetical protein [Rhizobium laguerreae]MBY3127384.1 hypothetical protein [Rhizobium laguerreae]MBY3250194.1 hypothetical protein [Rhizobium laguerreae]
MGENSGGEMIKFGVTTAIAVATVGLGLFQFASTSALSVREPFVEEQTRLCIEASEHAARLASTIDPETWKKSREEFWMLYLGPLAMVEDVESQSLSRVANKMVDFGKLLNGRNETALPMDSLRSPALDIAHACQASIRSKWDVGILSWFKA